MDDKAFDEFIKEKAEGYLEEGIDEAALAAMRRRLAALPMLPWYRRYYPLAGAVAVMAVFTLMNFLTSRHFSQQNYYDRDIFAGQLEEERKRYIILERELALLKQAKTDTIYIYRERLVEKEVPGADKSHDNLSSGAGQRFNKPTLAAGNFGTRASTFLPLTGSQGLPAAVKNFLAKHHLLSQNDEGDFYLKIDQGPVPYDLELEQKGIDGMYIPAVPDYLPLPDPQDNMADTKNTEKEKEYLSAKTLRALARHNQHGVGWQLGVEGFLLKSNWDLGDGILSPGAGFLGEMIFSPSLRLELGIKLNEIEYEIQDIHVRNLPADVLSDYPDIDDRLGELVSIEVESQVLSLPLNLKYYHPFGRNRLIYAGIGYAPQLFLRQQFDYKYNIDLSTQPDENFDVFVAANRDLKNDFYPGTVSASMGTEINLTDKFRWQVGIFYERGLTEVGREGRELRIFGVKSSLWRRVR